MERIMINYKRNNKKGYEQMHLRMNVTFPIARLWEKDDGKGKKNVKFRHQRKPM